jgi:hypothetical protein
MGFSAAGEESVTGDVGAYFDLYFGMSIRKRSQFNQKNARLIVRTSL